MMIVKSNPEQDKKTIEDKKVSEQLIGEMRKYNEQLAKAGVLLDLSGLHGTAKGTRIKFSPGGRKTVVDGPFTESKELIVGYWVIQVKSLEEAIEWAKRAPLQHGPDDECEIEVRQFFEIEDLPETDRVKAAKDAGKKAGDVYKEMAEEARAQKK